MSSNVLIAEKARAPGPKLLAGLMVAILVYTALPGLGQSARLVAAIFSLSVAYWITEALPLPVTALLGTTLLVLTGSIPAKDAFGVYGDQIILLFIGSFILAKSMEDSGLDRRIAYWLLSRRWATRNSSTIILSMGSIACLISLFISNTATTAMFLPVGLTILDAVLGESKTHPLSTGVMLMLTWGSSVAVGTIVGTPPNVLGVGLIAEATGVRINFVQWAAFGMPITIVMLGVAWLLLRQMKTAPVINTQAAGLTAKKRLAELGSLRPSERNTMIGFFTALTLWTAPGLIEYILGPKSSTTKLMVERFPEAAAALLGATLLFALPAQDTESGWTMSWLQAAKINMGTILLFAGGLALGKAAFDSGLARSLGQDAAALLGLADKWAITATCILLAIALSEIASNTASATTMVPVAIAIAQGAEVSPIAPALGAVIGSNLGFMLPLSTAPNAIVYASGVVPLKTMMRHGLLFDFAGFIVTWGCLRVILPIMNLA